MKINILKIEKNTQIKYSLKYYKIFLEDVVKCQNAIFQGCKVILNLVISIQDLLKIHTFLMIISSNYINSQKYITILLKINNN